MPWPTQPRADAPETVNLGPAIVEIMLGPMPRTWLLPAIGEMDPTPYPVADLCSQPPPLEENWGFGDFFAGINPETRPPVTAKLIRMAKAFVWPTYCEYTAEPAPAGPIEGAPGLLEYQTFGTIGPTWNDTTHIEGSGPGVRTKVGEKVRDDSDFFLLVHTCMTEPQGAAFPTLRIQNAAGGNASGDIHTFWPLTVNEPYIRIIKTSDIMPWADQHGDYWFYLNVPFNNGVWVWHLSAWKLSPPATPTPWTPPPDGPVAYQFTDAQRDAIVLAATEWPAHRITTSILPGMVTEVEGDVAAAQAAILAALANGEVEQIGFPEALEVPAHVLGRPADAVGFAVYLTPPAWMGSAGNNPVAWENLGWLTPGSNAGFHPSVRIKHQSQVLMPLPDDATQVAVDLAEGVTGSYVWFRRI
jgi:hypothetical protein